MGGENDYVNDWAANNVEKSEREREKEINMCVVVWFLYHHFVKWCSLHINACLYLITLNREFIEIEWRKRDGDEEEEEKEIENSMKFE